MKKLTTHIREHLGAYLLATFSLVTCTSLDMLSPQLTKSIIDDVIGKGEIHKLSYLLLGILGIGIARFIFGYIKEFLFDKTGARIAANMRSDLFKHVI